MLAANYSAVRDNLKDYCDQVCDNNETLIVTRKQERNVVMMSLDTYNEMEKAVRNIRYLEKLNKAFDQLYSNKGKARELIED